jgi:hypothetical protein
MRRAAGAMLLCLGLAGCGADEAAQDVKEAVDPVAEAAERTAESGGARIDGRMWMSVNGGRIPMEITGAVAFADDRLALRVDYAEGGIPGASAEEMEDARREAGFPHEQLLDRDVLHLRNPEVRERAGEDKWARIDLAEVDDEADLDLSGVASMSEINPSAMLEFLRTTGDSREAGTATIDGEPMRRYQAQIDYADYPQTVPPEDREAAERTVDLLRKAWGDTTLDVTVWIDERGLIRRERFGFDVPVEGETYRGTARMDFLDIGQPPAIDVPDEADTIDITEQMIEETK